MLVRGFGFFLPPQVLQLICIVLKHEIPDLLGHSQLKILKRRRASFELKYSLWELKIPYFPKKLAD